MVLYGLDISHHQGTNPAMGEAAAQGVAFCIAKATQGKSHQDTRFAWNIGRAKAAGLIVGAYHYQQGSHSAESQVDNVKRTVPAGMPVIPDVEKDSGGVGLTREIVARLREAGYPVPLLYLPRWYHQQLGSPSLKGLPPLWSSRYPNYTPGSLAGIYSTIPASYWTGYGGLEVALLQFTSSARVANYGPLDGNAFKGTRQEFAALLGGQTAPGPVPSPDTEENDMELDPGIEKSKTLVVREGAKKLVISRGFEGFLLHHVKWFGETKDTGANEVGKAQGELWIDPARPWQGSVPSDAVTAEVFYTLDDDTQHAAVAAFR
ncbi:glycoside hydrolase family 25 protein [Amycolatopsis sp. 195334CR]|uniref:glycoside hydrolase family 25 protein n=1 Tax=Amycolatopsis sp. 195334CR TaxID=2814588 RepID=UPI001A8D4BA6|nr:glycoside hydrolase family 25 protein [Amycolatopsis sp. 195334CR]MBN6037487.1 glycoside hydrolase family 25 protein [Amycolatopsis sp. 195334CR]